MKFTYCPICGAKLRARVLGDEGPVPTCESCGRPFFDSFSTCVIALVVSPQGEIAVLDQDSGQGVYCGLVSGYIKPGETAEEAARREIQEELGLSPVDVTLEETFWFERREQLMIGVFAHVAQTDFALSSEVIRAQWVSPDTAQQRVRPGGPASKLVRRYRAKFGKGATSMETREIYLAGGCFWGCQKFFDRICGVLSTEVGYANGNTAHPTYEQVKHCNTGHAETVRVTYDPQVLPLQTLLERYFSVIDPTAVDHQGEDFGHQYRTGIYTVRAQDEPIVRDALAALASRIGQTPAIEFMPLQNFYPAEESHQKYLEKNPNGYCHIHFD